VMFGVGVGRMVMRMAPCTVMLRFVKMPRCMMLIVVLRRDRRRRVESFLPPVHRVQNGLRHHETQHKQCPARRAQAHKNRCGKRTGHWCDETGVFDAASVTTCFDKNKARCNASAPPPRAAPRPSWCIPDGCSNSSDCECFAPTGYGTALRNGTIFAGLDFDPRAIRQQRGFVDLHDVVGEFQRSQRGGLAGQRAVAEIA
jgi:hypothetical protein